MNRRHFLVAASALATLAKVPSADAGPLRVQATRPELEDWDARLYYHDVKTEGQLFWKIGVPSIDDELWMVEGPFAGKRFVVRDAAVRGSKKYKNKTVFYIEEIDGDDRWHVSLRPAALTEDMLLDAIAQMRKPRRVFPAPTLVEVNGKMFKKT